MSGFPWLSLITFLPLACGVVVLALWRRPEASRVACLVATLAELALTMALLWCVWPQGPHAAGSWLLTEDRAWIARFGIRYTLALDGLSLPFVALTALFGVLCVLVSWRQVDRHVAAFHFFLLAALSGVMGVFLATDLFLCDAA